MAKVASISKDYSEGFDENSDEALVLEACRRIQKELDLWHDKLWKNTTQPDVPVCQRQYCSDVQDRAVAKAISAQKKWAKRYHGWAGPFYPLMWISEIVYNNVLIEEHTRGVAELPKLVYGRVDLTSIR